MYSVKQPKEKKKEPGYTHYKIKQNTKFKVFFQVWTPFVSTNTSSQMNFSLRLNHKASCPAKPLSVESVVGGAVLFHA